MVERIKEIILKEGLTSGSFADLIGVQRSSMSHIINGRNNPSLDFIVKTLQHFPKIDPEWLLTGSGTMYKSDSTSEPLPPVRERSIFDTISQPVVQPPVQQVVQPNIPPSPPPVSAPAPVAPAPAAPEPKPPVIQEDTTKISDRYVDKVMIFYSDRTYDEFLKAHKSES
jgi:transcriptional regulator with XRE-family HTH domain